MNTYLLNRTRSANQIALALAVAGLVAAHAVIGLLIAWRLI